MPANLHDSDLVVQPSPSSAKAALHRLHVQETADATRDGQEECASDESNRLLRPLVGLYRRRWVMLLVFCLISLSNAMVWITAGSVANNFVAYYGVSGTAVDSLSLVYMVVFIPGIVPSSWVLDNRGLRCGVVVGALLNCAGAWLRSASTLLHQQSSPPPISSTSGTNSSSIGTSTSSTSRSTSSSVEQEFLQRRWFNDVDVESAAADTQSAQLGAFALLFAGQVVCAAAQCFLLHVPPKIAANWFPEDERARCTSIGALANQLGTAVAFVLGPTLASTPEHVPRLLLVQNCGILVATLLLVAVFRDRPPLPPSLTCTLPGFSVRELVALARDLPFLLLSVVFGVVIGAFYAVSTILNETMVPLGYTVGDVGLCGMLMVVGGLLGACLAGYLVDLTHRYKLLLMSFLGCTAVCLAGYTAVLAFAGRTVPLLASICTLMGFFMTGLLPVGMEAAVISTHPIPEAISAGLLLMSCQVFGILFVVLAKLLEHASSPHTMTAANLLITGAVALATMASLFWRMQPKRLDAEDAAVRDQEVQIDSFQVEELNLDDDDRVVIGVVVEHGFDES
eukprot:CAMPEP_0177646896 /NCGR_PEP_ID=MMETSP0447-20121125/10012_1 /TAXON_ID=0 /ORGANISM="Stygamoeba regulata, Strain BSH-02190019" /LENGTH=566 /DNA_ID=CAMNT_0019149447 /DNA_START=163 /DNA_END=1863 /DNA_ORIENTATION=+